MLIWLLLQSRSPIFNSTRRKTLALKPGSRKWEEFAGRLTRYTLSVEGPTLSVDISAYTLNVLSNRSFCAAALRTHSAPCLRWGRGVLWDLFKLPARPEKPVTSQERKAERLLDMAAKGVVSWAATE